MASPLAQIVSSPMPSGRLDGPAAWRADEMRANSDWMRTLTDSEIEEVLSATNAFLATGTPIAQMRAKDFSLPTLASDLAALRQELVRGRGFAILRGLPVADMSAKARAVAYFGLGTHLGRAVSQNGMGHLLGHVIDLGRTNDDPNARTYQTRDRQFFHSDSADLVGLLCVRKARQGGLSAIVSSATVYNEMLARSPELTAVLFEPQYFDRRGEVPAGEDPWYRMPIFNWHHGDLSAHYVRRYIESVRRFPDVPALTSEESAAFDLLDEVVELDHVQLRMDFEPGDIQLLHNPQILHDRTAFEDWDAGEGRRHLLRLWLCVPDGRELPACYAGRWGSAEVGNRGGIVVPDSAMQVPIEPEAVAR